MIWAAVTGHGGAARAGDGATSAARWEPSPMPTGTTRRHRYARSSTASSVTQLLSESCSSLLQRLTTRVRGPSAAVDTSLGTTRSRLEDKYSAVLKRREPEPDAQAPVRNPLAKSATTALLTAPREKTPQQYHHQREHRGRGYSHRVAQTQQPQPARRTRHKSGAAPENRTRTRTPRRVGRSEQAAARLYPVEIPLDEAPPDPDPDPEDERQAKRKEIRSLILKYSVLDEAYDRLNDAANKYRREIVAVSGFLRRLLPSVPRALIVQ